MLNRHNPPQPMTVEIHRVAHVLKKMKDFNPVVQTKEISQ